MPILQVYTTLARTKIPAQFASKTAELLSRVLNKPIKAMCICVNPDQSMFNGNDPDGMKDTALLTLRNIGEVSEQKNRKTTEELSQHFEQELGIKSSEIRIVFIDLKAECLGINGQLRSDIK